MIQGCGRSCFCLSPPALTSPSIFDGSMHPDNDRRPYTVQQIDFLAAYVIPVNVWYIVPAKVATRLKGNIWLSPHKPEHKHERFMEAWELL